MIVTCGTSIATSVSTRRSLQTISVFFQSFSVSIGDSAQTAKSAQSNKYNLGLQNLLTAKGADYAINPWSDCKRRGGCLTSIVSVNLSGALLGLCQFDRGLCQLTDAQLDLRQLNCSSTLQSWHLQNHMFNKRIKQHQPGPKARKKDCE